MLSMAVVPVGPSIWPIGDLQTPQRLMPVPPTPGDCRMPDCGPANVTSIDLFANRASSSARTARCLLLQPSPAAWPALTIDRGVCRFLGFDVEPPDPLQPGSDRAVLAKVFRLGLFQVVKGCCRAALLRIGQNRIQIYSVQSRELNHWRVFEAENGPVRAEYRVFVCGFGKPVAG